MQTRTHTHTHTHTQAGRTLSITGGQQYVRLFEEDRGRGQRELVDGGERLNKKN